MRRVYLDHIAATPIDPEVLEAMLPFLSERFGNPQSLHSVGQDALQAVEEARSQVARLIGAEAFEIHFTASGSEANNLALKGMAMARRDRGSHLVVSAIEHLSVLHAAKSLERSGFSSTLVGVDRNGLVDPEAVRAAIRKETVLVSVILASSEVGTIQPVAEVARICREAGVPFHTDAVAAAGNIPLDVKELGVEIAMAKLSERQDRMKALRDRLIDRLPQKVERVYLTGHRERRLPHHASFCVEFIEGEGMLLNLDMKGIAVSSGSACTSRALKASHVLLAMGIDHALAQGSLVFSLLDSTTAEDIDYLLEAMPPVVDRLRKMSPLYTKFLEETKT